MKPCNKCHRPKSETEFPWSSYIRKRDGVRIRAATCKACKLDNAREWRKNNIRSDRETPITEEFQEDAVRRHIAEKAMIMGETEAILDADAIDNYNKLVWKIT